MANGKSSWLKSILIKEDEPTPKTTEKSSGMKYSFPSTTTPTSTTGPIMASVDLETPDQAYLDHLYKFMEDQNLPGPDYFEFANTLYEMAQTADIPEQNLFQLAYVSLKTQGVTRDELTNSAQKYVSLFEKHKKEFENVLSHEIEKSVDMKTQESQALENNNKQAEIKMAELQQQIQTLNQQMVINTQKIIENNNFIQNEGQKQVIKKTKFEKAYSIVVDKVNGDIQKIQTYVK